MIIFVSIVVGLLLVYIFRRDFFIWWYTPWCIPCQRYTTYVSEQHNEYSDYVDPEHYQCMNCYRICSIEDAKHQ